MCSSLPTDDVRWSILPEYDGLEGRRDSVPMLRRVVHGLRHPIIPIFVTAGVFEILARDPLTHAIFLFVMAGVLIWERLRIGPGASPERTRRATSPSTRTHVIAIGAAAVYAAIAGHFARYSWPITAAVCAPILVVIVVAWYRRTVVPSRETPIVTPKRAVVWAVLALSLGLAELVSALMQPSLAAGSYAHPTITHLLDPLLSRHPVDRSLAFFLWMSCGWLLVRT